MARWDALKPQNKTEKKLKKVNVVALVVNVSVFLLLFYNYLKSSSLI